MAASSSSADVQRTSRYLYTAKQQRTDISNGVGCDGPYGVLLGVREITSLQVLNRYSSGDVTDDKVDEFEWKNATIIEKDAKILHGRLFPNQTF